jgi:hypothetical protein
MVATYDKGVKNLISGLNATGHVTHTKHRKTMVTIHHNGGRLSHEGVLNVWKTRPASAHFDVDGLGEVAQYVEMNEYAWATGSTNGNQQSISIEMCNESVGGTWKVSETTWRSAARLTGWIFAKVIGTRPSDSNVVPHHFWKSTECAGSYMDGVFTQFISVAQQAYDFFVAGGSSPTPFPSPGGVPTPARKTNEQLAQEVLNGAWGNGDERRRRLTEAGYNYDAVQTVVNQRLGSGAPAAHRPSINEIARQVIRGQWGNGVERRRRLEGAGYNYAAVQAEVNRLL